MAFTSYSVLIIAITELQFWKDNVQKLNGLPIWPIQCRPSKVIYFDPVHVQFVYLNYIFHCLPSAVARMNFCFGLSLRQRTSNVSFLSTNLLATQPIGKHLKKPLLILFLIFLALVLILPGLAVLLRLSTLVSPTETYSVMADGKPRLPRIFTSRIPFQQD